jgi:hypothetical protein
LISVLNLVAYSVALVGWMIVTQHPHTLEVLLLSTGLSVLIIG